MSGGTLTPPRDPGPPQDEELLARIVPLRRRGNDQPHPAGSPEASTEPILFAASDTPRVGLTPRAVWGDRATSLRPHVDTAALDASAPPAPVKPFSRSRRIKRPVPIAVACIALAATATVVVLARAAGHPRPSRAATIAPARGHTSRPADTGRRTGTSTAAETSTRNGTSKHAVQTVAKSHARVH